MSEPVITGKHVKSGVVVTKSFRLDRRNAFEFMPVEVTVTRDGDRLSVKERHLAKGYDIRSIAQAKAFIALEENANK